MSLREEFSEGGGRWELWEISILKFNNILVYQYSNVSIFQLSIWVDQYYGGREMRTLRNINIEIYEHFSVSIFKCINLSIWYLSGSILWRREDENFWTNQYQHVYCVSMRRHTFLLFRWACLYHWGCLHR